MIKKTNVKLNQFLMLTLMIFLIVGCLPVSAMAATESEMNQELEKVEKEKDEATENLEYVVEEIKRQEVKLDEVKADIETQEVN